MKRKEGQDRQKAPLERSLLEEPASVPDEETSVAPVEILRSEVNLLTLPFFALSRKELSGKDQTIYRARVERDGRAVEVLWKVSRSVDHRYPGPFDRKVHKAIEEILNELPLPIENPIPFSIYDLCRRMGISTRGGKNYRKVKEALKTVVATTIESYGTFYCKGRRAWVNDIFHLYDRIVFKGEQLPDGRIADTNYLYLGSWYLESLNNRYVKPLDYSYYKTLRGTVSQRLYELLGVKFYRLRRQGGEFLNYRYPTLCALLPVKLQPYPSLARQQLGSAHRELITSGFLERVEWEIAGEEPGSWRIYYYPGPRAWEEIERWETRPTVAAPEAGGPGSSAEFPPELEELERTGEPGPERAEDAAKDPRLEEAEARALAETMLELLGDKRSRPFYLQLARRAVGDPKLLDLVYRVLGEVKEEAREGLIRTTKGAVFTDKLKRYCRERGIDLGLKDPRTKSE